jgi:hypothetical protein
MYDKGVEARLLGAGRMWRLELEVKYRHAEVLCREMHRSMLDPHWVASYVTSRWLSWGLHWPLRHDARCLELVRPGPKPDSSAAALLHWLERSVQPVCRRLAKVMPLDHILVALGLADALLGEGDDFSEG